MNSESLNQSVVLIIDDESQMRRLLRASLERNNYVVLEAPNGATGIEQVRISRSTEIQPDWKKEFVVDIL